METNDVPLPEEFNDPKPVSTDGAKPDWSDANPNWGSKRVAEPALVLREVPGVLESLKIMRAQIEQLVNRQPPGSCVTRESADLFSCLFRNVSELIESLSSIA